jgi:serine/threonine protein phosphatase PrpC
MPMLHQNLPPLRFDCATGQLQGSRARQEDSFLVREFHHRRVVLLADGLGGHPDGDAASQVATAQAAGRLLAGLAGAFADAPPPLRAAFAAADAAVRKLRDPLHHEHPPASTLIGGVLCPYRQCFDAANIGDSLALLLRDGELRLLFVPQGIGSHVEHALGSGTPAEIAEAIDVLDPPLPLRAGDRLLLASDGIEVLSTEHIAASLGEGSARHAVESLLRKVIERAEPGQDNCTLIVIAVHAQPGSAA